jgi:hypothetical protein
MWVGKMISVLDSRLGWQIWVFISFPHVTKLGKILKSTKVKLYFEIDYSPRNCAVDPFRPIWNHIHKTTLFTLEIENTTENLQQVGFWPFCWKPILRSTGLQLQRWRWNKLGCFWKLKKYKNTLRYFLCYIYHFTSLQFAIIGLSPAFTSAIV